jgi:MFS family permease
MGGRLGAVYSHKNILAVGCVWWVIWSLGSGFSNNIIALSFMRGLTGIGGGLLTPNAVALLGINFPPGGQRNLAMGLFGAMAPVGAAGGSLASAVFVQLTEWKWIFFFLYVVSILSQCAIRCLIYEDELMCLIELCLALWSMEGSLLPFRQMTQ